jgi:hypothetical protein
MRIEPIYGVVTSPTSAPGPASTHTALATINYPEGQVFNQTIALPRVRQWADTLDTFPLSRGEGFLGLRIEGEDQLLYRHLPVHNPCGGGGGFAPLSSPIADLRAAILSMTNDEMRMLKRRLEAV